MYPLKHLIGWNVEHTSKILRRELLTVLKQYGISPEQWQVMFHLWFSGSSLHQKDLALLTSQGKSSISRIILKLERKGWIHKETDPDDVRATVIYPTDLSLQFKHVISHQVSQHFEKILKNWSSVENQSLILLLKKLRQLCLDLPEHQILAPDSKLSSEELADRIKESASAHGLFVRQQDDVPIIAPLSLDPYPITKEHFDQIQEATLIYNELMMKVSHQFSWLETVASNVAEADDFTKNLLEIAREQQNHKRLLIGRNDFLFPHNESPKQVEYNTISSSFLSLAQKVFVTHQNSDFQNSLHSKLIPNDSLHEASQLIKNVLCSCPNSIALMVVQPNELNVFDQFGLLHELRVHRILMKRVTFEDLFQHAKVVGKELYYQDSLVSLVYWRTGYRPEDYASYQAWEMRMLMERADTFHCPDATLQLAGMKSVQQELTNPEALQLFLNSQQIQKLKKCYVALRKWGKDIAQQVLQNPDGYVLKPQREGGGNNFFGQEIVKAVSSFSQKELEAHIVMEYIPAQRHDARLLVNESLTCEKCVTEVGIYGGAVWQDGKIQKNTNLGYLARTKLASENEGGVCAGYACLNSLYSSF